ncbi:hypothetical protein RRG08_044738 [Elysia crispata]|uniref:Uncharacterized protein n=1 Tax=Elysia crispata TaxID=231223 RepID=A0AAE1DHE1_9GAST|nr:hypothetical protein RRG08_044738 [Elysia crispata]
MVFIVMIVTVASQCVTFTSVNLAEGGVRWETSPAYDGLGSLRSTDHCKHGGGAGDLTSRHDLASGNGHRDEENSDGGGQLRSMIDEYLTNIERITKQ